MREAQYASPNNLDARIAIHRHFSTNPHGWLRWLFEQLDADAGARVLDIGCGPAALWVDNVERVPRDWSITLADLSPGMLEAARERLGADMRFACEVADVQQLPFGDDTFDLAIASHMLYHVPDHVRALRELRRVVSGRGIVYVSTVGRDHMRELHELVQGRRDAPLTFLLENGADELRLVFDEIELREYVDSLAVTETEPLLAVVRSSVAGDLVDAAELETIRDRIESRIAREGAFHVTKATGVFVCR